MTVPDAVRRGPRAGRPRRQPIVPNQHGAWGFLALPVALGLAAGGWSAAVPALVVAWTAAYPLSWALTGTISAPRPERFRRALVVWSMVAVPAAVVAVVTVPWLLVVGVAFVALFGVNLWFARQRRERALANDLVFVVECSAMVPVVAAVAEGYGGWAVPVEAMTATSVLVLTAACALTLVGSTLHVKSLIRERRNPRYARASRAFALASLVVVGALVALTEVGAVLVVPFVALAVRAYLVRDPRTRPARIGLVELACLVLLSLAALPAT